MARKRKIDPERDTDEYKKWTAEVRKRDKNKCRFPDCNRRARDVHHIIRWADAPSLRYEVGNGICLCGGCHYKIRNKENIYAEMFIRIVENL